MSDNGKKIVAIDPSNPPPGVFMLVIIEKLNEQGQIVTEVQGKIDEPYALECVARGFEVLKIHQDKLKEKIKDTTDMKILE